MRNLNRHIFTAMDITSYIKRPIFQNSFKVFYNEPRDIMIVVAKDNDSLSLLHMYSNFDDSPTPKFIQDIFGISEDYVALIEGHAIEDFADSLLEFLLAMDNNQE